MSQPDQSLHARLIAALLPPMMYHGDGQPATAAYTNSDAATIATGVVRRWLGSVHVRTALVLAMRDAIWRDAPDLTDAAVATLLRLLGEATDVG